MTVDSKGYSPTLFVAHDKNNPQRDGIPASGYSDDIQRLAGRASSSDDDLELLVQLAAGLSGRIVAESAVTQLLAIYASEPSRRALIGSMCLKLASLCSHGKAGTTPTNWNKVEGAKLLSEAKLPAAILYLAGRDAECGGEVRNFVADELSSRLKRGLDPDAQGDRAFGESLLDPERFVTHQELYGCVGDVHPHAPVRTFSLDLTDAAGITEPVRLLKEAMREESQKSHLVFVNTGGHWTLLALVRDPAAEHWEAVYFDSIGGHGGQVATALTEADLAYGSFSVVEPPLQKDPGLHCACGPLALLAAEKIRDLPGRGEVATTLDAVQDFARDFAGKPLPDRQAAVIVERARMLVTIEDGARRQEQAEKAAAARDAAERAAV